jgi:hypothetical protein
VKRGVTQGFVSEDVAAAIDLDEAGVTAILGAMEGKVVRDGELLGWEKRNPKREDSSYARVLKHRETQRNAVKRPDTEQIEIREEQKVVSITAQAPQPKAVRKSLASLPDDFPPQSLLAGAEAYWRERDRDDLNAADEAEKFRAHHKSHGSRMADWGQAWVTWYSNAIKFNRKPNNGRTNNTKSGSSADQHISGIADLAADIRAGRA